MAEGGFLSEIVGAIDDQISVRDDLFLWDIRLLIWLPAVPFAIALCFVELPSTLGYVIGFLMFASTVPWTIFLFRRRAAKKREWVEPKRFSDENNGY
ncbi:MAG TPA: hypothetical protein VM657_01045 [Sphingomonas sp.]|nr:hypothetical protein [Sphingomonas sp.]